MFLEKYLSKKPTILNDPFEADNIVDITVYSRRNPYNGSVFNRGTVEFQNGNTKGEQRFEGSSFDDIVLQIKSFIESL